MLLADLLAIVIGSGRWQLTLVVALAMTSALLITSGQMFVTQAAVQSIIISALVPAPSDAFVRVTDAVVGGCVALVAATVVPAAPLRRPRERAAIVVRKISALLRAAGKVMVDGVAERGLELLADARATDSLIRELQDAADEGMAVVSSSPFRSPASSRHPPDGGPGRAARPRAAEHPRPGPPDRGGGLPPTGPSRSRTRCWRSTSPTPPTWWPTSSPRTGWRSPRGRRWSKSGRRRGWSSGPTRLTAEVVLGQLRSVIVDLLLLTGMTQIESTEALPPPPRCAGSTRGRARLGRR